MKLLLLAILTAGFSNLSFAITKITCENQELKVELDVDVLKSNPPQTSFSFYEVDGGSEVYVGGGALVKQFEDWVGGELNFYNYVFMSDTAVIGVATSEFESPSPGTFSGYADFNMKAGDKYYQGLRVNCKIEIK